MHLPALIQDLAVILGVAGVVTLVFKRIGQPVVLGYLLAGFLVGPQVQFIPTVQEKEAIRVWADLGVIVLLFGLGLEFSFRKLAAVGRSALITGVTEVLLMLGLGYVAGQVLGWPPMDSLFLGGIVAISSTTIIIRALDELGLRERRFAGLVFGVLVVEDLVAVLLLVLFSTVAVTNTFTGTQLLSATVHLGFLLTLWFLGGIFLVPWLLRRARPLMNEETSLIVSLALCLLMAVMATRSGVSAALGAFIMGSILAETPDGEKIERILKSVKDLFAAVFFVSVGMLIDVGALSDHWPAVVLITVVVVGGKFSGATVGALLSGQSLRTSVQTGLCLTQIGEFSFLIAALGMNLKVISDHVYPLAVAVSALTTLSTPYLIRAGESVHGWIERRLPNGWVNRLNQGIFPASFLPGDMSIPPDLPRLFLNSVVIAALALASSGWLLPFLREHGMQEDLATYTALGSAVILSLPSMWAIITRHAALELEVLRFEDVSGLANRAVLSFFARSLLAVFLLGFILVQFTSAVLVFVVAAALSITVAVVGFKNFAKIYRWFESRFVSHLTEKERQKEKSRPALPQLAPWDAHLVSLEVHPDSSVLGRRFSEIGIREFFGVTVAMIERGSRHILAPRRDEVFMAHDRLYVIGNDDQLAAFAKNLAPLDPPAEEPIRSYGLGPLLIDESSRFRDVSIRESRIREEVDGLVVGLERAGQRILNPDAATVLQTGDLVWIVGDQTKLAVIRGRESAENV